MDRTSAGNLLINLKSLFTDSIKSRREAVARSSVELAKGQTSEQQIRQSIELNEFHSALHGLEQKFNDATAIQASDKPIKHNRNFASILRAVARLIEAASELAPVVASRINRAIQGLLNKEVVNNSFFTLVRSCISTLTHDFNEQGLPLAWSASRC